MYYTALKRNVNIPLLFSEIVTPVQRKRIHEHARLRVAASHVLGSAKNSEHCGCVYVLAPSLSAPSLIPGLVLSGFPPPHYPPSTHTPYHSVSSSCVPVFTACSSVWRGSGYRQSDDSFFQSPFINTAPRAFLTTKQCVLERGKDQREGEGGEHGRLTCGNDFILAGFVQQI